MKTFEARNTNEMAAIVYSNLLAVGTTQHSRNGKVLTFTEPCTFTYRHPEEMVNLCPIRDANPFFHLMEAVAMVSEYNSVEYLSWFNSNMKLYSDDGKTYNAFYGTRMGGQFNKVVTLLHKDPETRQAVIQLWRKSDLLKNTKDKACNMSMVFRRQNDVIDMTVFCRSNDLIYGGVSGANIVHFPFIHAVMCYELDCVQGRFTHVVNNAHVYLDNPHTSHMLDFELHDLSDTFMVDLDADSVAIKYFCALTIKFPKKLNYIPGAGAYINGVLVPMYNAFAAHKYERNGLAECEAIKDEAWKQAAVQWLHKRESN